MPVGEGRAAAAPLADPSRLQAAQERRDLLAQGQKDMLVPPPVPKPVAVVVPPVIVPVPVDPAPARRLVQPDGSAGSIKSCPPRQAKPKKQPKPLRPRSRPPAVKARTPSGGRNEIPLAGHPLALIARVGRRKHGVK